MRNILFICNTHFQVLIAVIMKMTKFTGTNVDIILSDQMNDSVGLYERLNKNNLFRNVYSVKIKGSIYETNKFERMKVEIAPSKYKKILNIDLGFYDELFLYNTDIVAELAYFYLEKINSNLKVNLFDEGVSTYSKLYEFNLYGKTKISYLRKVIKKLSNRKYIVDSARDLYLLDPDLICWDFNGELHRIDKPDFTKSEVVNSINAIFGFEEDKSYNSDYIFFEESYFLEGKEIGDLELVENLAEKVSKSKITVKIHPRNIKNRFEERGIKTNNNTAIPWEVIALNMTGSEFCKKFITVSSSAVLSSFLLFGKEVQTMMLYKYLESDDLNKDYFEYFEKFGDKYPNVLSVPNNQRQFEQILEKWEKPETNGGNR